VTPAEQVADQLTVTDTVEPTTPQEVLDLLTAQKQAADPARAAFAAALRELATYVEGHPELPVPTYTDASPGVTGDDEEQRVEVNRIAAVLGVEPQDEQAGHYSARRLFGDERVGVTYRVTAIPAARMAEWDALVSYDQRVTP
jgi:hypothetical protein